MINFRFHIVSLVAVFLAFALGITVGATVVNRELVDSLNNEVEQVDKRAKSAREENKVLERTLDNYSDFVKLTSTKTLANTLTGTSLVFVADRGIDNDDIAALQDLGPLSGASGNVVIWLEKKWGLDSDNDTAALAEIVGVSSSDSNKVRKAAVTALVGRLKASAGSVDTVLTAMVEGDFLSLQNVDQSSADASTFFPSNPQFILVSGQRRKAGNGSIVNDLAAEFSSATSNVVVGEIYGDPEVARGSTLTELAETNATRDTVSTVDNVDQDFGRVSAILAVIQRLSGGFGHYGTGSTADAVSPSGVSHE